MSDEEGKTDQATDQAGRRGQEEIRQQGFVAQGQARIS
jgi:hypothetical protein